MDCSKPGFPVHRQILEFAQTHVHRVGDVIHHLILCWSLLLLPSIFPSIKVFPNETVLRIRWSKYWSFIISPSSEYSRLISFSVDWLELLAVQGTLKSLLQHHHSKASILQHSAFFYSPTLTSIHDYLAIVNSAAMNTGVHISLKVFSRYIPRTAGSYGNSFWGTSVWFSMVAEPIYIPTNSVGGFPSLNILSSICYL